MKLEYEINEQDFLDFQLFAASKSDRINKKKRKGWLFLTIGSMLFGFYFFLRDNSAMTIYFGLVALACGLFYPRYFNWKYKRHYRTYIRENYSKRFGQIETLEINNDSIISKDKTSEGKINISEIERIEETNRHFFLKISNGISLLIPKTELINVDALREKFKEVGLKVNDETNWTWN